MKTWLTALLCLLTFASPALAEGFYLGVHGGAVFLPDADTSVDNTGVPTIDAELERDAGWLAGVAAGYAWSNGLALEAELTYRRNGLDNIALLGMDLDLDGDQESAAALANAYYRLNNASNWTPYAGLGIGVARVTLDADAENGGTFKDSETGFAYQAMAGVDYALTPQLDLGIEYRYFATEELELSDTQAGNTTGLETEYRSHNLLARLTYRLQ